jgi:hypothetical protein
MKMSRIERYSGRRVPLVAARGFVELPPKVKVTGPTPAMRPGTGRIRIRQALAGARLRGYEGTAGLLLTGRENRWV